MLPPIDACPNKGCVYHGITDQSIHALVGDGVAGVQESIQWWRAYYHFVRVHESLREPLAGGARKHRQRTPAMPLGLTDRVWSVADILTMPLPPLEVAA